MDLQKNKKRAQRRARNYVAKHMHEHKRGGPMSEKKRELLEEQERKWMEEAHKELDNEVHEGAFATDGE